MGHGHDHTHGANKKVLLISFIVITAYMIIEAIGGILTHSLALLSDAGHMLSDSLSLGIALLALTLGGKAANHRYTYGYKRMEILAAVFNGLTLLLISFFILYEAVQRFSHPLEIASTGMLLIASMGLLINLFVAWMMLRNGDVKENINMKGAYLHVISDMIGSIGAIVGALLIMFFGWGWADPLASIIVALLILRSGYLITKEGIHILLEGTPQLIDVDKVIETITNQTGIQRIHDLHVWTISSGFHVLSCHAVVDEHLTTTERHHLLQEIEHILAHLSIHHTTIQLETSTHTHDDAILCTAKAHTSSHHHHHHHH